MIVSVDLDILIQEFITPDDYLFLWGLYSKYDLSQIELFPNYVQLEEKGLIKIGEDYMLTNQGRDLFTPKGIEAKFIEFWTSYPISVPNGRGGKRSLRDSSSDTKLADTCKKKYIAILHRNPKLHNSIIKAMERYVKSEFPYLKNIEVFLNQETWNKYIDSGSEKKEDTNISKDNKTIL